MDAVRLRVARCPRCGDIRIDKATLNLMLHQFGLQVLLQRHG